MDYKPNIPKYCTCSVCDNNVLTKDMAFYKKEVVGGDYFPNIKSMCNYKCVYKVLDEMLEKSHVPKSNLKNYGWIKRNIISISPLTYSRVKIEEIIFLCGIIVD